MSLVLPLALFAAAPLESAQPQASATEEEITVIGRKLANWRGRIRDTLGIRRCKTTQSTGDAEIDKIGCKALSACWPQQRAAFIAAAKSAGHDEVARREAMKPVEDRLTDCFRSQYKVLIAELADRRAAVQ